MRLLVESIRLFCADRLTVGERWLLVAFLGIVVLGSMVKYSRARPESDPLSNPPHPASTHHPADDLQ